MQPQTGRKRAKSLEIQPLRAEPALCDSQTVSWLYHERRLESLTATALHSALHSDLPSRSQHWQDWPLVSCSPRATLRLHRRLPSAVSQRRRNPGPLTANSPAPGTRAAQP